jgi:hypothetical protein
MLSLEAAYNAAAVDVMEIEDRGRIREIVAFDEDFSRINLINLRIYPSTPS